MRRSYLSIPVTQKLEQKTEKKPERVIRVRQDVRGVDGEVIL